VVLVELPQPSRPMHNLQQQYRGQIRRLSLLMVPSLRLQIRSRLEVTQASLGSTPVQPSLGSDCRSSLLRLKLGTNVYRLVKSISNVIIRNIAISKVLAENGDAIGVSKCLPSPYSRFDTDFFEKNQPMCGLTTLMSHLIKTTIKTSTMASWV